MKDGKIEIYIPLQLYTVEFLTEYSEFCRLYAEEHHRNSKGTCHYLTREDLTMVTLKYPELSKYINYLTFK